MNRKLKCFLLLLLCPLLFSSFALAADGVLLTAEEWSWTGEQANILHGVLKVDGDGISDAVWTLEIRTDDPEHSGTVVFTEINGGSLNRRKRSNQVTAVLLGEGNENSFVAEWYPDTQSIALSQVTVHFQVESPDGTVLASGDLTQSAGAVAGGDPASRLLYYVNQAVFFLIIAASAVWVLAVLRLLLLRRRKA